MRRFVVLALLAFAAIAPAAAVEPDEVLDDPALEARAVAISRELRCVVCQSQSIDDSDAPLAKDMRIIVRERLVAGDTDAEVRDFLVARYGDYVLLRPPVKSNTIILWTAPMLLFLFAACAAGFYLRRMKRADEEAERRSGLGSPEGR